MGDDGGSCAGGHHIAVGEDVADIFLDAQCLLHALLGVGLAPKARAVVDEDDAGVRVGRFGKLEVVADEEAEDEEGADKFDQEEYRRAMAALRQGRMLPDDLKGIQFDRHT